MEFDIPVKKQNKKHVSLMPLFFFFFLQKGYSSFLFLLKRLTSIGFEIK
jgi:hypothetical protein